MYEFGSGASPGFAARQEPSACLGTKSAQSRIALPRVHILELILLSMKSMSVLYEDALHADFFVFGSPETISVFDVKYRACSLKLPWVPETLALQFTVSGRADRRTGGRLGFSEYLQKLGATQILLNSRIAQRVPEGATYVPVPRQGALPIRAEDGRRPAPRACLLPLSAGQQQPRQAG
ncbi:hypothetical protein [Streptomyces sp. AA4]|uniref:hypothetical protein n=1 Tax=Streptomyces sp. AA4 TaxID=591158 RepID=UPI001319F382|nr:hypothetical protein [Streptomyces sp. AA4]